MSDIVEVIAQSIREADLFDSSREMTDAILAALSAKGYAVVPRVLSNAMRDAVNASIEARLDEYDRMEPFDPEDYAAMLAAVPPPPKEKT